METMATNGGTARLTVGDSKRPRGTGKTKEIMENNGAIWSRKADPISAPMDVL